MFDKILIANRGEIAVRIMRTAKRLGVRTVAVYSQADATALHVQSADEALCIGPAPAAQSYLRAEVLVQAAQTTGAQAIHPGYGFLSENAAFATACQHAGLIFIGPPSNAIAAMGSKIESKRLMAAANVPLVPGYHDAAQDIDTLRRAAERIGYPVLIKASAGGGGKGMRIVHTADELDAAVTAARRESIAAFGDDKLLLEKYLPRARHVEVQVFADQHGQCLSLFDRDCSLQRRHQKVIEEAPAPGLSDDVRASMAAAAVAAARAVNYVGAGTVEFLYQDGEFYFIEMNTRLQVEHPVTEMITGLDLVEWQLRVACGEPLPLTQSQVQCRGHAFEARVYAEDPQRGFLPATGRLQHLKPPLQDEYVRVDSGVRAGDDIAIHYDPLIAKLIVWDENRSAALQRLQRALRAYEIAGVTTNINFLAALAEHPIVATAQMDAGFIERHREELIPPQQPAPDEALVFAALALLRSDEAMPSIDVHSPWNLRSGWQLNAPSSRLLYFKDLGMSRQVRVHFKNKLHDYDIEFADGKRIAVKHVNSDGGVLCAELNGGLRTVTVIRNTNQLTLLSNGEIWRIDGDDPLEQSLQPVSNGALTALMPGVVTAVLVKEDEIVVRDQPLMVLEAMKMEHTLKAAAAGRVVKIHFAVGQQVSDGAKLLTIESEYAQ